jgi:hypothetical protein
MDIGCPWSIANPLTGLSFRGQLSMKLNIFHFSWKILKFSKILKMSVDEGYETDVEYIGEASDFVLP